MNSEPPLSVRKLIDLHLTVRMRESLRYHAVLNSRSFVQCIREWRKAPANLSADAPAPPCASLSPTVLLFHTLTAPAAADSSRLPHLNTADPRQGSGY